MRVLFPQWTGSNNEHKANLQNNENQGQFSKDKIHIPPTHIHTCVTHWCVIPKVSINTRLYLVTGWGKGPREAEKGQGQVDEAILIGLKLLVSLYHFVQLQTHKANYSCCRCSSGWDDLPGNQLALWHRMWRAEVIVKRSWQPTEKVVCGRFKFRKGSRLDPNFCYLMPVCEGNVIVLCPEIGCSHNEIHVEVGVIILLLSGDRGRREEADQEQKVSR